MGRGFDPEHTGYLDDLQKEATRKTGIPAPNQLYVDAIREAGEEAGIPIPNDGLAAAKLAAKAALESEQ